MGRANSTAHLLHPLCRGQPHRQHVKGLKIFAFIFYFYLENESRTLLRISMKFFNGGNADVAIECLAFRLLPAVWRDWMQARFGHAVVAVSIQAGSACASLLKTRVWKRWQSPKATNPVTPQSGVRGTTEAALCSPLPFLWVMPCPFTLYVSGKIPTLTRSQFLIREMVKFKFAWKGTDSQDLGTMDLFLVLPLNFFQHYFWIHLIPAFSITMFILQKANPGLSKS